MFSTRAGRKARTTCVGVALVLVAYAAVVPRAQNRNAGKVTTPKEQFGHDIGDDYCLVNYTQYVEYLQKLDQRVRPHDGRRDRQDRRRPPRADGHHHVAREPQEARRSSRTSNRRLALAEGLTDDQARQLAQDGKTVVWIDGGLHATEVLGAQQLIETIYRLNTQDRSRDDADPERRHRPAARSINPDGMELVSNWYMREPDEKQRSTGGIPRLYQKYIGHDDNRDFYMMNQSESVNANQMMYREWFPAIMYNHHQTGPAGAVLFAPPFRDPFNYHFDPLVVARHRHGRLGDPHAAGRRRQAGRGDAVGDELLDLVQRRHPHDVVLPQPDRHPDRDDRQPDAGRDSVRARHAAAARRRAEPDRAADAGTSAQSIEYSVTNNYAILDIASKRKEDFLFNMYKMGKNAIEQGQPRPLDDPSEADRGGARGD